jgi:hypothetical protein
MILPRFVHVPPRVGVARRAHDPAVAGQHDGFEARVTISQQRSREVFEELGRAIAMPRDREVEHVGAALAQAAIDPHPGRDVRLVLGPGCAQHLVNSLRPPIVAGSRNLRRQEQHHPRLVGRNHLGLADLVGVMLIERLQHVGRTGQNVEQRRAVRHPAAPREPVLLPIDRQVIGIFGGHNLGGNAGVVAVAFHQRILGPRRLSHAALGMIRAGELRILGHPHSQLGPLELERLGHVVADDQFGSVLGTVLLLGRDFRRDFIPRQVLGKLFAPRFSRLDPAADGDLFQGFCRLLGSRVGQAVSR